MRFAIVTVAAACITLAAGVAHAQPPNTPPGVDHYLVYPVLNPPSISFPVILSDQFLSSSPTQTISLQFFMNPVNKNNEGIIDDITHYTWWQTNPQPFGAICLVSNQFRPDQQLNVSQPRFLLNPALKGLTTPPQGTIPPKNHYRVYDASGQPIEITVGLQDQFFAYQAIVHFPRFLAPPVDKIFQGVDYPILDPVAHLVIYDISILAPVPPPQPPPVFAKDEFGTWQLQLGPPVLLAVPSYKTGVVPTHGTTWGKLKSLYR